MTTPADIDPDRLRPPLRVLIVEDATSTRRFLRAVLDSAPAFDVVGESDRARTALEAARDLHPDVILLDLSLPDADGAEVLPHLLEAAPEARIVVLSNNSRLAGPELVTAGATGFISKGLAPRVLIDQLTRALGLTLPDLQAPPSGPGVPSKRGAAARPVVPRWFEADANAHPERRVAGVEEATVATDAETSRAVIWHADPMTRRTINWLLTRSGVAIISEVVTATETRSALCAAVALTRPDLAIIGQVAGATTGDVIDQLRRISPTSALIAYTTEPQSGASADGHHVEEPDLERLELCVRERLGAPGTAALAATPFAGRVLVSPP